MPYTIEQIEKLLDSGQLEIQMSNGNHWTIRRNGMTKRWKRDFGRFSIPFKAGFRSTGQIYSLDLAAQYIRVKGE